MPRLFALFFMSLAIGACLDADLPTAMEVGSCGACRGSPMCDPEEPVEGDSCGDTEGINCFYCTDTEAFDVGGTRWVCNASTDGLWERDRAYDCAPSSP
ncbi:MAG: hypothetical protein KTR31_25340 [Myxococcales bacterium]|nr:hypothetical protein [Myxococcales bacterium]